MPIVGQRPMGTSHRSSSRRGHRSSTPVRNRPHSSHSRTRNSDTSILRGANIIREQIKQRLEEQERNRQRAVAEEDLRLLDHYANQGKPPVSNKSRHSRESEKEISSAASWLNLASFQSLSLTGSNDTATEVTVEVADSSPASSYNEEGPYSKYGGYQRDPYAAGKRRSQPQSSDSDDDGEDIQTLEDPAYLPSNLQSLRQPPLQHRQDETGASRYSHELQDSSRILPQQQQQQQRSMRITALEPQPKANRSKSLADTDPGYAHALAAGLLWRSLVGEQVRFPKHWVEGGARAPPLGNCFAKWKYIEQTKVTCDQSLRQVVSNRAAPGRLVLHIIVLDTSSGRPIRDIAIGCFHPNARGVREAEKPTRADEGLRTIWMAVRKRSNIVCEGVDKQLKNWCRWEQPDSPLLKKRVSNSNVRVVFGDEPPLETILVPASELSSQLERAGRSHSPALILLQDFVFA